MNTSVDLQKTQGFGKVLFRIEEKMVSISLNDYFVNSMDNQRLLVSELGTFGHKNAKFGKY